MKKIYNNKRGVALLLTILMISLVLFLAIYFLNFSVTEKRISKSQAWGAKTYYLAESGVQEMVWRLKNDVAYKNSFETNASWAETFIRNNPFGPNSGSYTVTITNSSLAHGDIVSTGSIDIGGSQETQRIVKTSVYRAMGSTLTLEDNCGYADGNINLSFSLVNFYNGSAHSNNNFIVNGVSTINIDTDLNVANNYNKSWLSTVNYGGILNNPASEINMPAVDFDSTDSESLKNKADVVYTESQFEDLLDANQNLILNDPITYVEGDVDLYGDFNVTINGLLVVERDFEVGRKLCWSGWSRCGRPTITVNHIAGEPSGILAKRKVYFKIWTGGMDIDGVIYANDQLDILSFPLGFTFNADGGLVSRKLTITSVWSPINITRNEEIMTSTIGDTEFSQVITVEHWEEEY
jgi:Tfp pilus assembly protein PilX